MNWNRRNILKIKGIGGIYIFRDKSNGKVYIGQTVDFYMRYGTHISRKEKSIFSKVLHKRGIDNFQFGILEVIRNKDHLNKREEYWIGFYQSYKRDNGYNHGPYSQPFKRRKFTKEHSSKISVALKGIKRSPESYKQGILTKIKLGVKCASKKVTQIDVKTLEPIGTYDSIKQAADATNTPRRSISYSINNFKDRKFQDRILPKAGNFYWKIS